MRKVVAIEGVLHPDGRTIANGALYVEEPLLPVIFTGNWQEVIGSAADFQREGNEVSMWIEIAEPYNIVDLNQVKTDVYLTPYVLDDSDPSIVTTARVRMIAISMLPMNNGRALHD